MVRAIPVAEHPTRTEAEASDPLRVVTMVLLAAMTLAVLALGGYLMTYVRDQRETAECYQMAFDELHQSLSVSREAARQDRAELRTLVESFVDPGSTNDSVATALDTYLAALDAADADRSRAPLPSRTCG